MTSNNNPLTRLETATECSISGLFQELLNKGFNNKPSTTTTEPLKFGDSEGSDFKRLLHKKDKQQQKESITTVEPKPIVQNKTSIDKHYHQASPDFRPVIYVNNNPTSTSRAMNFGTALYSFLFQHEDRYFNHDRDELSKDIFPVGQAQV